jgi:choline-glycine betaine transporter
MADDIDDTRAFEAKETAKKIPVGWQILFWGLILWGVYYTVAHTPAISGWSQERAYMESLKP